MGMTMSLGLGSWVGLRVCKREQESGWSCAGIRYTVRKDDDK